MNTQATLTIPRPLYERARLFAKNQRRDVAEVVTEVLEHAFPPVELAELSPEQQAEVDAFHRLHSWLLEHFAGEYAAIYHGELVDHDADFAALLQRIEDRFPEQFVLIRPVRQEPEIVYVHRAVRWD